MIRLRHFVSLLLMLLVLIVTFLDIKSEDFFCVNTISIECNLSYYMEKPKDLFLWLFLLLIESLFLLFILGYWVSLLFYSHGSIDLMESIALSIGLSVVGISLFSFYMWTIGIPINSLTIFWIVTWIISVLVWIDFYLLYSQWKNI